MSARTVSMEMVIRLLLPTMRSFPCAPNQNASIVSVQTLSSSNLIDSKHHFCVYQIAIDHLVSGDLPADTIKKWDVCFITDASAWRLLLHRMDGQTKTDAGHERT